MCVVSGVWVIVDEAVPAGLPGGRVYMATI